MASFTNAQKVSIRNYLGYGEVDELGVGQASITFLNNVLNRTDFDADFISSVVSVTSKISAIELALFEMVGKAKLSKADVLEFNYAGNYRHLIAEGTRLVQQLSGYLGNIPIRRNIFLTQQSSKSMRSC